MRSQRRRGNERPEGFGIEAARVDIVVAGGVFDHVLHGDVPLTQALRNVSGPFVTEASHAGAFQAMRVLIGANMTTEIVHMNAVALGDAPEVLAKHALS